MFPESHLALGDVTVTRIWVLLEKHGVPLEIERRLGVSVELGIGYTFTGRHLTASSHHLLKEKIFQYSR